MFEINPNDNKRARFEVRVGHARVTVEGFSSDDAVRNARERLSLDMPRLWDVIQSPDRSRFEVNRLP